MIPAIATIVALYCCWRIVDRLSEEENGDPSDSSILIGWVAAIGILALTAYVWYIAVRTGAEMESIQQQLDRLRLR